MDPITSTTSANQNGGAAGDKEAGIGSRTGSFRDQYIAQKKRRAQLRDPHASDGSLNASVDHGEAATSINGGGDVGGGAQPQQPPTTDILAQIRELSKSIQENYAKVAASKIQGSSTNSNAESRPHYTHSSSTPIVEDLSLSSRLTPNPSSSSYTSSTSPQQQVHGVAGHAMGSPPPSKVEEAFAALRTLLNKSGSNTRSETDVTTSPMAGGGSKYADPQWVSSQVSPLHPSRVSDGGTSALELLLSPHGNNNTTTPSLSPNNNNRGAAAASSQSHHLHTDDFLADVARMTGEVLRAGSESAPTTTAAASSDNKQEQPVSGDSFGAVQDALRSAGTPSKTNGGTASSPEIERSTPDRFSPPLNRPTGGRLVSDDDRTSTDEDDIAAQHSSIGGGHGAATATSVDGPQTADANRSSETDDDSEDEDGEDHHDHHHTVHGSGVGSNARPSIGRNMTSSEESFEPVVLDHHDDSVPPPHHQRVDTSAGLLEEESARGISHGNDRAFVPSSDASDNISNHHKTSKSDDDDADTDDRHTVDDHVYNLGDLEEEEEHEEEPESELGESGDGAVNDGVKTTVLFHSTEPQLYELMASVGRWDFEEDSDHSHLLQEVEAALEESLLMALKHEEQEYHAYLNKFRRTDGEHGEDPSKEEVEDTAGPTVTLESLSRREGGSATIKLALGLLQKNVSISHKEKQEVTKILAASTETVIMGKGASDAVVPTKTPSCNNSDVLRAQYVKEQQTSTSNAASSSSAPGCDWQVSDLSLGRRYLVPSFPLGGGVSTTEHHKLRVLYIALSSEIMRSQRLRAAVQQEQQRHVPSLDEERLAQLNARAQALIHVVMKMASTRLARKHHTTTPTNSSSTSPTASTTDADPTSEELLPFSSSVHINKATFDRRRYFGEPSGCLTIVPAMLYAKSLEQALATLGSEAPALSFMSTVGGGANEEECLAYNSCVELRNILAVCSATHTPFDETILVKRQILDNWHHTGLFEKFAPEIASMLVQGGEFRMRGARGLLATLGSNISHEGLSLLENFVTPQLFHAGNIVVPPMSVSIDRTVVFSASKAKLTRREALEEDYRRDARRQLRRQKEAMNAHQEVASNLAPVMREFPLKVVMNPFKTGFEDEKEVPLHPGMIVAGRYQLMEVLGQATFSRAVRCIDLQQKYVLKEKAHPDEEDEWVVAILPIPDEPLALGEYTYEAAKPRRHKSSSRRQHKRRASTSPSAASPNGNDDDDAESEHSHTTSSSTSSCSSAVSSSEESDDDDKDPDNSSKRKRAPQQRTTTNPNQPDSYVQLCLKVINNSKEFFDQSLDEIRLLHLLNTRGDADSQHFLRMHDYFYFREHTFIITELLSDNLYEYGKYIRDSGLPRYYTVSRVRSIARQLLKATQFVHSLNLMHSDLKPENILFVSHSRCEIKVIDFGSSCFTSDHLSSYVQSRSYRAPEVILGADYDGRIDVWSIGAILVELVTQEVLFQSETAAEMLARIVAVCGMPLPRSMLYEGRYSSRFVDRFGCIYEVGEKADAHGEDCYYLYTPVHRHCTRYVTDADGAATGSGRSPNKQSSHNSLASTSNNKGASSSSTNPVARMANALPAPHVMLCSTVEPYSRLRKKLAAEGVDPRSKFVDFVTQCLTIDHKRRPTCEELLQHPFLQEADSHEEDANMTGMQMHADDDDDEDDRSFEECEGEYEDDEEEEEGVEEEHIDEEDDLVDEDEGNGATISKRLDDDFTEDEA